MTSCAKCGHNFEQHPLAPERYRLCPACRGALSWDELEVAPVQMRAAPVKPVTSRVGQPASDCG